MKTKSTEPSGGVKILEAISALIMIAIGIYLIITPRFIVWLFSAAVMIYGAQLIAGYFTMKDMRSGWDIIAGIINLLFGGMMLFGAPETRVMGVLTMEMFIAVWALFAGFSHIFGSFGSKKLGVKNWYWVLVRGVLTVIFGIVLFSIPILSAIGLVFTIGVFTGAMFILSGISGLAGTLSGKNAV